MRKQTPKKNLLIVCEGTVTEPFYFKILADKAIEKGEWDNVEIIPEPRNLDDDENPKSNKRPKRTFKNTELIVPENTLLQADETEKKYLKEGKDTWAMPLRFVKEARDRLSNGAYDEAWVVFDRNGHPAHEAAFGLAAETDKPVNIAFSSRSFEQWVLLHFEKSLKPFESTECKIRQKGKNLPLDCMSDKPLEGSCEGDKCLVGYLRKNYLLDYSKKGSASIKTVFEKLSATESINNAVKNSAWLRAKQRDILRGANNKPYLLNPYTTVDVLVKRLLGIVENIEWVQLHQSIQLPHLNIVFELEDEKHLKTTFTNTGKTVFMLNQTHLMENLYCTDSEGIRHSFDLEAAFVLLPNQTGSRLFTLPENYLEEWQIHYKTENYELILMI